MDLKEELLAVLNNPARVWDAVVANLAIEPRMALLVLTTCKTPISLVSWQEALARVSIDAAVKFESSLRILDDSFISSTRIANSHRVTFRNPSMDDFCAGYLDRNVGVATTVVSKEPALHQIIRLIELGTAFKETRISPSIPHDRKFPNIYEALIADPSALLQCLIQIRPSDPHPPDSIYTTIVPILDLLSQAKHVPDRMAGMVRSKISTIVVNAEFSSGTILPLYSMLDDYARTRALIDLLGDDFEVLYENLSASAHSIDHFDTLVNVDHALGRAGVDAQWATRFTDHTDELLMEEDPHEPDFIGSRDMYERIAQHLELDGLGRLSEWDDMIRDAEREAERSATEDDDADWAEDEVDSTTTQGVDAESLVIDAMFAGLQNMSR